ncbi:MAG: DUF4258 domain-containing protein [Myxococcales bacterium]|nr:MAG: DUF4258 domain-containing protein [Myxococcales bacterium]
MKLVFRAHALQRMFERAVSVQDVRQVLEQDDKIENYSDDKPFPSALYLGDLGDRMLHVVAAKNKKASETVVITVYEPSVLKWQPGFRVRRKET